MLFVPPAASPKHVTQINSIHWDNFKKLTILLDDVLAWRDELCKALELVTGHCTVPTTFQRQIGLKVGVQVLLKGHITYEAHSTQGAVELDSGEDLDLGGFDRTVIRI